LLSNLIHHLNKLAGLGRGNPGEVESPWFDTHVLDEILEQGELSSGVVITFQVMAVTRVSAGDPNSICTLPEGCQEKFGIHPARAGHPDGSYVRRILQSAHTGKIRCPVGAPVTKKGNYLGLPIHVFLLGHSKYSLERRQNHCRLLGM